MRRSRVSELMRRPARVVDDMGLFGPVPPIDPLMIDYWDANIVAPTASTPGVFLVGGQVDSWKGHVAGIVIPAPAAGQRPLYGTDGSLRGNVVQSRVASSRGLANTAAGAVVAASTRPYSISAYRLETTPGASVLWGIFGVGILATSDPHYVAYQTFGGAVFRPSICFTNVPATVAADTISHVSEAWADGVNANVRDNATPYTLANISTVGASNLTAIAIGRAASGNTHFCDCNHAWHGLFSAKPSEAYIARLKAWLNYSKGTPP